MAHCCVPQCHNRWQYRYKYENMNKKKLSFHVFPREIDLRRRWIAAIRRDEGRHFKVQKRTYICSAHFMDNNFKFTLSGRRCLKEDVVPTVFTWNKDKKVRKPPKERQAISETSTDTIVIEETYNERESYTSGALHSTNFHDYHVSPQTTEEQLEAAKTHIWELEEYIKNSKVEKFGLHRFSNNDDMIRFYTGFINYKLLIAFFNSISQHAEKMIRWTQHYRLKTQGCHKTLNSFNQKLPLIDQFFMFLHKLRLGSLDQDLADKFNVSQATVSRNTISWVNFLYCVLGSQPLWPSREQVKRNLPECFKRKYKDVRVILDCTELKVQSPSSLVLNSELYSNYKGTTTYKSLIGITPAGAVSFVSTLYSGSISDKHITQISGILDLLEPGDKVMADKGFLIEEMLLKKHCDLVIPNFLAAKGQFSASENSENQVIANLRVHVERAIRRVREYHIFDGELPLNLAGSINQTWAVCCLLTNFQGPLIVQEH